MLVAPNKPKRSFHMKLLKKAIPILAILIGVNINLSLSAATDSTMKPIQSGADWTKYTVTDNTVLNSPQKPSNLLPGENQIYIINSKIGAQNAPLPLSEKNQLMAEMEEGETVVIHAGFMDAVKSNNTTVYNQYVAKYAEYDSTTSTSKLFGCFGSKNKSKSFNKTLFDLQKSFNLLNDADGNFTYNLDLNLYPTAKSTVLAKINYKVKKFACVPYKVKFREFELKADLNVQGLAGELDGELKAKLIDRSWELTKLKTSTSFFVGPVYVKLGLDVPIEATLEADVKVSGKVGLYSQGNGRILIHKVCDGSFTCTDKVAPINTWNSSTTPIQLVGGTQIDVNARPGLSVALEPYLYNTSFLSAKVGVNAGINGHLWGYAGNACGDADSNGSNEFVTGLAVDINWNIRGIGSYKLPFKSSKPISSLDRKILKTGHIYFKDFLSGGSSALRPMIGGNTIGPMSNLTARMRPCYPFKDTINYAAIWGDGTSSRFSAKPTTAYKMPHTYTSNGRYLVRLRALSDTSGRSLATKYTNRYVNVDVNDVPKPATAPSNFIAFSEPQSGGFVDIYWNSVSYATSYQIYKSTSSTSNFRLHKSTSATAYFDNINSDTYYKVRACNSKGCGPFSTTRLVRYQDSTFCGTTTCFGNYL